MRKKKLSYLKALELSEELWGYLAGVEYCKVESQDVVKHGFVIEAQQEAVKLYGQPSSDCWLCEHFIEKSKDKCFSSRICAECPLNSVDLGGNCLSIQHPFYSWCSTPAKWHAEKIERSAKLIHHTIAMALAEEKNNLVVETLPPLSSLDAPTLEKLENEIRGFATFGMLAGDYLTTIQRVKAAMEVNGVSYLPRKGGRATSVEIKDLLIRVENLCARLNANAADLLPSLRVEIARVEKASHEMIRRM